MILQALFQLAEQEHLVPDPDYEVRPVAWLVPIDVGGRLLPFRGTHVLSERNDGKAKPLAKSFTVPRQPLRTSGDRAFFFCDKSEYVFGLLPSITAGAVRTSEKLGGRFALFREQIGACADATHDVAVDAVRQALDDVAAGRQQVRLPDDCQPNDLFAFIYAPDGDQLVHERRSVREYWKEQRRQAVGSGASFQCAVTGQLMNEPGNFPKVKRVPGGTSSGVSLVSFNAPAFESYGLSSNENAPISRAAAEAAATALDRLLHPAYANPSRPNHTLARRHIRLSEDTVVCYWASSDHGEAFVDVFAPLLEIPDDPRVVGDTYRAIWNGRTVAPRDAGAFYALTLSGAQGRVVVRDWFETSVAEAVENLAQHFADLAIVRNTPPPRDRPLPPQLSLPTLLGALAPFGKKDQIPAALAADIVRAALRGSPYPVSLLQRALERTRAEIGKEEWSDLERRDARAALIKAVLNRRRRTGQVTPTYPEISAIMDPTNTQPGYLLGRLMAVIERLQQLALGDVNAGVVDRYFGAASATPRAVFVRLLKNARHHARKAKDDPQKGGSARWLERQIDAIAAPFDPKQNGFPAWLDLEQQGLFVLGYHQQRHALWTKREDREPPGTASPESGALPADAPAPATL
jgi:CRISPR-associated protein Csd1